METMTREEQIRNAADEHFAHSWSGSVKDAFAEGAHWADEQNKQEKQQLIDEAMKVICDGCAQKVECEFYNWKTGCSQKDKLIKAMEEQL